MTIKKVVHSIWNGLGRFLLGDSIVEQSPVYIASKLSYYEREILIGIFSNGPINIYFQGDEIADRYIELLKKDLISYIPVERMTDSVVAPRAVLALTEKGTDVARVVIAECFLE